MSRSSPAARNFGEAFATRNRGGSKPVGLNGFPPHRAEDRASSPRRWTINGDFVALKPTGVARYAREVTSALDTLVSEGHPLTRNLALDLVAPSNLGERVPLRAIPVKVVPEYARPRLPQAWVQLQLPRHVTGGLVSFCNLAPVTVARHIVCIHDLQTRLMPESYGRMFRLGHRVILPLLGRRAAAITTVSHQSARDLVRFGVTRAEKLVVTHNGCDHALRWRPDRADASWMGERPFVLCIGRSAPYKNVALLCRIAADLDALGLDLVMAGDIPAEEVAVLGGRELTNLRLIGPVDDDGLAAALARALCFAFPSKIEGFGLPAVEAMALGCPVVASTAPSLPEVCGDAALFADPDDLGAWVEAIDRLRREPGLRDALVAKGRARAALYSWRGIALIYLQIMAEIDGQPETGRTR